MVMLSEDEVRNIIAMEKARLESLVDPDSIMCSRAFICGLECVLND